MEDNANPRQKQLRYIVLILSCIGLYIAGVLTVSHYMNRALPCGVGSGCEELVSRPAAKWFGVPVALFGVLGYLVLAILSVSLLYAVGDKAAKVKKFGLVVSVGGALVSIGLIIQSLAVIHITCTWCICSAVVMVCSSVCWLLLFKSSQAQYEAPQSKAPLLAIVLAIMAWGIHTRVLMNEPEIGDLDFKVLASLTPGELTPGDDPTLGPDNSPNILIAFSDLQCPQCRAAMPLVEERILKAGDMKLFYRYLPLHIHKNAKYAAYLGSLANEQHQFWPFTELCYSGDGDDVASYKDAYTKLGLNLNDAEKRLANPNDPAVLRVERDISLAKRLKISGTPTFIFMRRGETPFWIKEPARFFSNFNNALSYQALRLLGGDKTLTTSELAKITK